MRGALLSVAISVVVWVASTSAQETRVGALANRRAAGDQYGWAVDYETTSAARPRHHGSAAPGLRRADVRAVRSLRGRSGADSTAVGGRRRMTRRLARARRRWPSAGREAVRLAQSGCGAATAPWSRRYCGWIRRHGARSRSACERTASTRVVRTVCSVRGHGQRFGTGNRRAGTGNRPSGRAASRDAARGRPSPPAAAAAVANAADGVESCSGSPSSTVRTRPTSRRICVDFRPACSVSSPRIGCRRWAVRRGWPRELPGRGGAESGGGPPERGPPELWRAAMDARDGGQSSVPSKPAPASRPARAAGKRSPGNPGATSGISTASQVNRNLDGSVRRRPRGRNGNAHLGLG